MTNSDIAHVADAVVIDTPPTVTSTQWIGNVVARSSIAHGGETRGTQTLLRRELMPTPTGMEPVPVISGNALRGQLRRVAYRLFANTLQLDGKLPLPAAHALINGGSLTKTTGQPLSGSKLAAVRQHIPPVGIFGCAAGGSMINGCLSVGKVVPHTAETAAITGDPTPISIHELTQLEEYSSTAHPDTAEPPMRFAVETFPAGTQFSTWLRLDKATDLQHSFFLDVLADFTHFGRLGGRLAIGHGLVTTTWEQTHLHGIPTPLDWREWLLDNRDSVAGSLNLLT